MKILIDARFTRLDHHDGISRYGASLIAATARIADVSMLISDARQLAMLADQYKLAARLPDGKLEVIPGVGHLIHYETPEPAARYIRRFLKDHAA